MDLPISNFLFALSDTLKSAAESVKDRVDIWSILVKIWNFELFSVKDHSVQINHVVVALVLLSIGLMISRWLTRLLYNYMRKHTSFDQNTVSFIQRITFYCLCVVIIISTLQMVQFPITMFAFLGGAIAIGVGFGAQNIFNNFISGMILMIERPVRIGDLIEVDIHLGRVEYIGARCTRIRRVDGIEILVPNSMLLENNITNRTFSDKKFRANVVVGVAYGSPTKQAADIIISIVRGHTEVLTEPEPEVFFIDFGDNALVFEVFFWVEVDRMMDIRRIQSEVRFSIDEEFRKAEIVIAYPQRDVHMDTLKPLDIRIVDESQ